ncbi:MAG: hypothetical protein MAG431_01081 [Chloroflexi bacterium]|nr:hypothetical protein [Chloroflexota bacterium]
MNGGKCIQANVEGEIGKFNALGTQSLYEAGGEMQSRCGSGRRANFLRVDGLVAFRVVKFFMDVGREGDMPGLIEKGFNWL